MKRSMLIPRVVYALLLLPLMACGGDSASSDTDAGGLDIPTRPFASPTGPHAIGMFEMHWRDESRPERFTKDPMDTRHVSARIWYPAPQGGSGDAPYLLDLAELGTGEEFAAATQVETNATLDAPISAAGPFPVLIYNHGGGATRFLSTFTTEELASHGYVVVSVGHNGFNMTQVLPDGASVTPDTLMFPEPTGDFREDARGSWDYLGEYHFPEWVADATLVLDHLTEVNREGPLAGAMDLENIGMYGWSFGGATAIEASSIDPRVKAAIDHDGQLFGTAPAVGTSRPFMLMHGGETPEAPPTEDSEEAEASAEAMRELMQTVRDTDASLKAASTGDWYDVTIAGATHGNFSDFVLMIPGSSPGIDAARGHAVINALTVAFFDRYLKGTPSSLLVDSTTIFPEVTFERRIQP
jgi:predicted dienelactone hydrolase